MNYGIADKIDKKDKRQKRWAKQRKKRGFDDTETWDLFVIIAKFIYPRLKRLKKVKNGYPANLTEKKWNNILKKMIAGFKESASDEIDCDYDKMDEALKLFAKYYRNLWW